MRLSSVFFLVIQQALAMAQDGSVTVGNVAWGGLIIRFGWLCEGKRHIVNKKP
jgi:hypothetical protein